MEKKRKTKEQFDRDFPHHFICATCAVKMGGVHPENSCNTVHRAICPYCEGEDILYAVRDFDYPLFGVGHIFD